ncbi:MAG TPA: HAD family phosphatase [Nitrospiraceae bacterium]|nr:HAD family phosphatase [Nitrospiraceae bacterium]
MRPTGWCRALIFDFNGVLADDETPHFQCFQQALAEQGFRLTAEEYYGAYLGMDERTCTAALIREREGRNDPLLLARITQRKAELFHAYSHAHKPALFPGVIDLVKAAKATCRLAIASGGRREQIAYALSGTPIEHDFAVIVSADECAVGKPDPAIYALTLKLLNGKEPRPPLIRAEDCLVLEDSQAGILSAKQAGMHVIALATTYPASLLSEAHAVLPGLEGVTLRQLTSLPTLKSPTLRSR